MFIKTTKLTFGTGLSVAWLALMSGAAMAESEPVTFEGDLDLVVIDAGEVDVDADGNMDASYEDSEHAIIDPVEGEDTDFEVIDAVEVDEDGNVDASYEDSEQAIIDPVEGGDIDLGEWIDTGDETDASHGVNIDELGPGVLVDESMAELPEARSAEAVAAKPRPTEWDAGNGPDPFARGNICLDEAMYVGWLCDWQRPHLGLDARP